MQKAFSLTRRHTVMGALASLALPAWAQGGKYPSRNVRIVLPQPPGGAADRLARLIGERLEAHWKQSVIIENKPGGGVVIGTQTVARSAPDGYTIGLLGSSLSINAVQRKDLPYRIEDLTPIARAGYYTVALVASSKFPANDIKSLIEYAKSQPADSISFGSNGIGTSAHVAGEMLNHMGGIQLQHVPYNGAAKMYTDIAGGVLPMGFSVVSSAESFISSGQMKVLGVTSLQRSPMYPQWPTIADTLPGFEAINWAGFCGPAGMPREITQQIGQDLIAVLKMPDMAKSLQASGFELAPQGPAEFGEFIQSEIKRFAQVTKPLPGQK
ncbi:Bug family tripartite tricarboxylate transporter substrate binding protein [Hydrogenophaga laconesensis]|uniref:Tripartite-type tricarboxylate transporter receptor subunit TctC n=1 Tax=Hydrogenophaga laconesensis TaxID=1805971 RepID=A0ABU1V582_9BURK|nr:tripartite tricarboxylate transporter substrate binding protein [Hydrogenophaga laconesensis]MDR7092619.1 tripartite-type tricarboxylate transporter receptor subunit TctC [Hydrogenophaga laconesensis]